MSNPIPGFTLGGFTAKGKGAADERHFEPCAATASVFLYAQGSTVVCLEHDTLAFVRDFKQHREDVQYICVDNVSERGAGQLVVTYDVGRSALVWDLTARDDIPGLTLAGPLTVAAWMKNGNLAYGNDKGEVHLFEPATQKDIVALEVSEPITAIAPAGDCKTYAIGCRNGSILLASLEPQLKIIKLTTSQVPSAIAGLTWHASSSKQKSDMLAAHTADGDLQVWSVAKPPTNTTPRIIRNLRQPESFTINRSWISWSKNGRILQLAEEAILAWDVRTKDVTYDVIPIKDHVRGIAAFGPTGTFFTLGSGHTIWQYDVDSGEVIKRVSATIPQTPPQEISQPIFTSESEAELLVNDGRARLASKKAELPTLEKKRSVTPKTGHGREESGQSSRSAQTFSPSKAEKTTTTVSLAQQAHLSRETYSPVSNKSGRKSSRLRQEVIMSPEERPMADLFPFTRERLNDVPYRQTKSVDEAHMTPDDLRRQMLSVVFGWDDDIHSLINEELGRLPVESAHAVYLSRWLGKDSDEVAAAISASSSNATLNWMRLALSSIGDSPGSKKVAQVLIEQMLIQGDVHAAVTALIACGDWNDAVEVYVSRNLLMEAVLLTCLLMPTEWQRLSFLVRKWGEKAVSQSEQHLAVRCYSCTGQEPSEPWTSPGAQLATSAPQAAPTLQPSIFHKTMERRSTVDTMVQSPAPIQTQTQAQEPTPNLRDQTPTSGLKLVTSFGGKDHYKFPGLMSDEGTPINAALITPIAESAAPRSAISPGGLGSYRSNNMRSLNSAMANRPVTPGGLQRQRLASIGETTADQEVPRIPSRHTPHAPPTPADSGSDKERERFNQPLLVDPVQARQELPMLLTPARYEPPASQLTQTPQTAITNKKAFPFDEPLVPELNLSALRRNSSRSRKPEGLSLNLFPTEETSHQEQLPSDSYEDPIDRPSTSETINSTDNADYSNPPDTGNSYSSYRSLRSPSVGGRSLDQYISSLEQAQYYKSRPRGSSITSKQSKDDVLRQKHHREESRNQYDTKSNHLPKKSPSSPIAMSPHELGLYTGSVESLEAAYMSSLSANPGQHMPLQPESRASTTTPGERRRHRSRSRQPGESKIRDSSRAASRRRSQEASKSRQRGRSSSRKAEPYGRPSSSPEPLQPSEDDNGSISSVDPALRIVSQNRHRLHSQSGRQQERSMSKQRPSSPERRSSRVRSRSRQPESLDASVRRKSSVSNRGDKARKRSESSVDVQRDHKALAAFERRPESSRPDYERPTQNRSPYMATGRRTKELAQAELEARRLSLQRRPSAPAVPLPGQDAYHTRSSSTDYPHPLIRAHTDTYPMTYATMSAYPSFPETNPVPNKSRPSTPKAMRHPTHRENASVPDLPNMDEYLGNEVYRPPKLPSMPPTASPIRQKGDYFANPDVPSDMPKHPAFDSSIGTSRPNSRNVISGRHTSPARGASRERSRTRPSDVQVMTIGEEDHYYDPRHDAPPVVPELQHLAMPPPPPPPPPLPKDYTIMGPLRIETTDLTGYPANVPLPSSAYPGDRDPQSAASQPAYENRHRRGRSGSEHQIVGKIRNFAGRMRSNSRGRSTSRPRDSNTKSPPVGSGEDSYSPYESLPNPNGYAPQMSTRELATVIEGRGI